MLKGAKKSALTLARPSHVDVFVEHYDVLRRWAVQFTENDHARAEDLLHDLFIHFTLARPDLDSIQNLEGYLYVIMRNLYLSQVRRATRAPLRLLSVVEYDTVEFGFWSSDPRERLRMRDELSAVCQYACLRKQSSKAGSVLILRFFHGYYPEEIAKVMHSNRASVDNRLRLARAEAKVFLEDPSRLSFIGDGPSAPDQPKFNNTGDDLRLELRKQIFNTRQDECLTDTSLVGLYDPNSTEGPDQRTLGHIVSCWKCLDSVNDLLDLPRLADRYPLDTVGKDPGNNDDRRGGGSGNSGGGSGGPNMLDTFMRRRDAIFHHRPEELCVSVNGHMQSFQRIAAAKSELTLVIDMFENLGFVEVFSEQGARLLLLTVEPPPSGDARQSASIELSEGRTVDANLSFGGAFPTLQVTYHDPLLQGAPATSAEVETLDDVAPIPVVLNDEKPRLASYLSGWRSWLQPVNITAAFAVLLFGVLGYVYLTRPVETPLTAANILENATRNEVDITARTDLAVRRTYKIEQWSNGNLVSRRRVDEWQKVDASARRDFDEKGKMIAGEWKGKDGTSHVFKLGEKLRPADQSNNATNEIANIKPTATQFASLIENAGGSAQLKLEESPNTYNLTYRKDSETEPRPANNLPGELLLASLALDRTSLDLRSETLVLRIGDETREYRFTDIRVEQKPVDTVSPFIFLPEAELLQGSTKVVKPVEIAETESEAPATETANTNTTYKNTATLDTEVEVMRALDSINALSGDQITVTRTAAGQLKVVGLVDGSQRKTEVLNALSVVRNSPGVLIDIQTREEAARKQKQTGSNISIESVTADTASQFPVEAELKNYFAKRGVAGENLEREIRDYSSTVLNRSRALRRNALAFKSLAERFSPAELDRLDAAKSEQWKALLRSKAAAVAGDVRSLQSQLSAVGLNAGGDGGSGGAAIRDASDVAQAAQRLFGLAAACDAQVSQSFSISGAGGAAPVKTVQFWRNLRQMADIAADVLKF